MSLHPNAFLPSDDDDLTIPPCEPGRAAVHTAYWTWLAFEHDGLTAAADIARHSFDYEAQETRWLDGRFWGLPIAEKRIARHVKAARAEFAEDLRRERAWLAYKAGQRSMPSIVGKSHDWRSRRRLPGPPDMTQPWA